MAYIAKSTPQTWPNISTMKPGSLDSEAESEACAGSGGRQPTVDASMSCKCVSFAIEYEKVLRRMKKVAAKCDKQQSVKTRVKGERVMRRVREELADSSCVV